jgi:hypothetical protein
VVTSASKFLYRILSFKHVVDMFESKELYFALPSSWDDPYEKILVHKRSHAFFAQCWCKKAVSDAMWRIYSQDRTAIRICTTRAKLRAALNAVKESHDLDHMIKDVEYVQASKIDGRIAKIARTLTANFEIKRAADALVLKRDAFDHEEEVRVLVNDRGATEDSERRMFVRVPVDPHVLVENIYFDPRADEAFERICTYYLQKKLLFKRKIGKSALYRIRDPVVVK